MASIKDNTKKNGNITELKTALQYADDDLGIDSNTASYNDICTALEEYFPEVYEPTLKQYLYKDGEEVVDWTVDNLSFASDRDQQSATLQANGILFPYPSSTNYMHYNACSNNLISFDEWSTLCITYTANSSVNTVHLDINDISGSYYLFLSAWCLGSSTGVFLADLANEKTPNAGTSPAKSLTVASGTHPSGGYLVTKVWLEKPNHKRNQLIPALTSNSGSNGYVDNSDQYSGSGWEPWRCFDGVPYTMFVGNAGSTSTTGTAVWIRYTFSDVQKANRIVITGLKDVVEFSSAVAATLTLYAGDSSGTETSILSKSVSAAEWSAGFTVDFLTRDDIKYIKATLGSRNFLNENGYYYFGLAGVQLEYVDHTVFDAVENSNSILTKGLNNTYDAPTVTGGDGFVTITGDSSTLGWVYIPAQDHSYTVAIKGSIYINTTYNSACNFATYDAITDEGESYGSTLLAQHNSTTVNIDYTYTIPANKIFGISVDGYHAGGITANFTVFKGE